MCPIGVLTYLNVSKYPFYGVSIGSWVSSHTTPVSEIDV